MKISPEFPYLKAKSLSPIKNLNYFFDIHRELNFELSIKFQITTGHKSFIIRKFELLGLISHY